MADIDFREKMKRLAGIATTADLQATAESVGCSVQTVRNALGKKTIYALTQTEQKCIEQLTARVQIRRKAIEKLENLISTI